MRQQLRREWDRHRGRQHRVDAAVRAQRRDAVRGLAAGHVRSVDPLGNLARIERAAAVEATRAIASAKELPMVSAEAVDRLEVRSIVWHAIRVALCRVKLTTSEGELRANYHR